MTLQDQNSTIIFNQEFYSTDSNGNKTYFDPDTNTLQATLQDYNKNNLFTCGVAKVSTGIYAITVYFPIGQENVILYLTWTLGGNKQAKGYNIKTIYASGNINPSTLDQNDLLLYSHFHNNLSLLQELTDHSGQLYYNGEPIGSFYTLPVATSTTIGGVKQGSNVTIASDGTITANIPTQTSQLTNDSGFLTSFNETDPIFAASPAYSITSTDITNIHNLSGTNTGDETASTIKTKLSISTLSGANTGDQDLSGLATKASLATVATTGRYADLTGNPTIPTQYTDTMAISAVASVGYLTTESEPAFSASPAKNITNGHLSILGNTSGVNTGDQNLSGLVTKTTTVNGYTLSGNINITASDLSLDQVNNTSDLNKPVSSAAQTALNLKANISSLANVATSGSYTDLLNQPTIPSISDLAVDSAVVHLAGTETISGQKTFNSNVGLNTSTFGTNNKLAINPYITVDNLATSIITPNAATNKGLVIQAYTSQTANLQEWQKSNGIVLTKIDHLGLIYPAQASTASAPSYVKGAMYFDTTLNKLRIGGATAWETVTSV